MKFYQTKYREKAHQRALRRIQSASDRLQWIRKFRKDPETPAWLLKWEQMHLAVERKFGVNPLLPPASPEIKEYRRRLISRHVLPLIREEGSRSSC